MAEEKKLGPKATYLNSDGSAGSVTVNGLNFKEGEAVDVVKEMGGEEQAKAMLTKLSKNPYFKVDGGPQHDQSKFTKVEKPAKRAEGEPPEGVNTPPHEHLERPDLPRGKK